MNKVVVTGRGVISPVGNSTAEFLDALRNNVVGIGPVSWVDYEESPWFAPVRDFEPTKWMDAKVADGTDLFAQFAIAAAEEAVEDAGLTDMDPVRTAVVIGTSMGGTRSLSEAQSGFEKNGRAGVDRKTMIRILPNMAAAQLAMRYSLHGPLLTVTTACASSIDAIGQAVRMVRYGEVDVALTGGTEAVTRGDGDFAPAWYFAQAVYGMTSGSEDPRRAIMPFDRDRNGIVIGDGSAMLVIESESRALARGAHIYAEILGYASLADGSHPSAPEPTGRWEAEAMRRALADAALDPERVDALFAHATGTPKGDAAEINAINSVHGGRDLPVTALKGHTGHTGASSGVMSLVAAIETLTSGTLPNVAGTINVDPAADFCVVTEAPAQVDAAVAQINSFGFGGQNASLVLGRYVAGDATA